MLLRLIFALFAATAGWAVASGVVVAAAALAWHWAWHGAEALSPWLETLVIAPPPAARWVLAAIVAPGAVVFLLYLILNQLQPLSLIVRRLLRGQEFAQLGEDHVLTIALTGLCQRAGLPRPQLWLSNAAAPNAFALRVRNASAIVLTGGLVRHLPPDALLWVLAHELGHIRHRDGHASAASLATLRTVLGAERIRVRATRLAAALLRLIPFPPVVILLEFLLLLVFRINAAGVRVTMWIFQLGDRGFGRAAEYRADAYATQLCGAKAGELALSLLPHGLEPTFNLFATHPTTRKRIEKIRARGRRAQTMETQQAHAQQAQS